MPVVALYFSRLQKLIGKVSKKQISELLPFLGLDIESEDNQRIRVEYSPNRPDYSTDFGIAIGLQGLFGMGIFRPEVTKPLGITKPVLAWGGGIERIAMLKYDLDDVREFYNNNLGWLRSNTKCQ